jgi:ParB/RepB/Spo0J family partition protein
VTIRAIVIEPTDSADVRVKQIIENDQRADVPPLEQARSYPALMDETGWTPAELGQRIGRAAHRITERTDLLKIAPEYQQLLAGGNLRPSEGTELAAYRLAARPPCSTPSALAPARATAPCAPPPWSTPRRN